RILAGVINFEEIIHLSSINADGIDRAYNALLRDHVDLFWVKNTSAYYTTIYEDYTDFAPNYEHTQEEKAVVEASMEAAYQEVLTLIPEGEVSTYDKIKTVYEYIIENTEYKESEDDQNVASVFMNHRSVCAGYASSIKYLLNRMNIECIYAEGNALDSGIGHAWNIVNIDGDYYYVDATYGDPDNTVGLENEGMNTMTILYDFLCPFPDEYEKMSKPDERYALPACEATAYNFYVQQGNYFSTYHEDDIYAYCRNQIDYDQAAISLKFRDPESYQEALTGLIKNGGIDEISQYYMQKHEINFMEFQYGQVDEILVIRFAF
ncbi:MAG: transglutaminase domain-containing protein, partial [Niameybacter sp.]